MKLLKKIKTNAEQVLSEIGLSMSEAINIYLRQIALRGGIPFDVKIPNRKTRRAMQDIQQKRNLKSVSGIENLQKELES